MDTVCGKPLFGVQHHNGHDQLNDLVIVMVVNESPK